MEGSDPPLSMPDPVRRLGVVGTGTMATGIIEVAARKAIDVVVWARSDQSASAVRERLQARLAREVTRGVIAEQAAHEVGERVSITRAVDDLGGCEVIVESIVEALEPKRVLFAQLGSVTGPETVLASNTSTLGIGQLAQVTEHPERVCGLHFFNPVTRMELVEVVRGLETSPATIARATAFAVQLAKTPIEVEDEAGFVVNALLFPSINAAVRLVERGVASAEDVDRAMVLGANHPLGPLALADLVGLDVTVAILDRLWAATGDPALVPAPTLRRLVAAGRLGRKSGWGFYRYDGGDR